ncbi:MAG: hypothetical protein ACREKL_04165 [Chthoniobacterales bacterium]
MNADDIRQELAASRRAIQHDYASLRAELDFVAKTKRAVVDHPLPWLGGSALVGWILSGRRKRKARKLKAGATAESVKGITLFGTLFALLRLIFPLARPWLAKLAADKLTDFATRRRH